MRRFVGLGVLASLAVSLVSCMPCFALPQNERQWIVDSVSRDVAEMVLFAAKHGGKADIALDTVNYRTSESAPLAIQNVLKLLQPDTNEERKYTLTEYVWSPANYSPWAMQLMKKFGVEAENSSGSPEELIKTLSNYDSTVIAAENKKLTSALTEHPLDAELQEEAALLCSTMALKECAACFTDVRPWLNRVSAHLSLAKALRGDAGYHDAGKLAEITLVCLGGREADAMAKIQAMESANSSEAMQSWLRSLKLRATHDYRIADLKKAARMERLEYGRALATSLSSDAYSDFLEKDMAEHAKKTTDNSNKKVEFDPSTVDWLRIGQRGISSVESGHMYAEPGVSAEMFDFTAEYKLYHDAALVNPVVEMDLQSTRCLVQDPDWKLEPISWNDLAAFHCRNLLDSVYQKFNFEENMWCVKDMAKRTMGSADAMFAKIRLYPLCKLDMVTEQWDENSHRVQPDKSQWEAVSRLMTTDPEEINGELWFICTDMAKGPDVIPNVDEWFSPRMLFGTAFDFQWREYNPYVMDTAELEDWNKLSPYSRKLKKFLMQKKYGADVGGDQFAAAFGKLAEYDLATMHSIAEANERNPVKYTESLEKLARYEPMWYFTLGHQYVDMGKPELALAAFQNGVRFARNPVAVANNVRWLVDYYYDHGQKDKAMKMAQDAAEVYSMGGLNTLAHLYERMGDLSKAEEGFKAGSERYNNPEYLCQFYLRHPDAKGYLKQAQTLAKKWFPDGVAKVAPSDTKAAPSAGTKFDGESALGKKYGLKRGDICIAIDGYRVKTVKQYMFIRELNPDRPDLEIVVWDGKAYRTVKATVPKKQFGVNLVNFPPSKDDKAEQ